MIINFLLDNNDYVIGFSFGNYSKVNLYRITTINTMMVDYISFNKKYLTVAIKLSFSNSREFLYDFASMGLLEKFITKLVNKNDY